MYYRVYRPTVVKYSWDTQEYIIYIYTVTHIYIRRRLYEHIINKKYVNTEWYIIYSKIDSYSQVKVSQMLGYPNAQQLLL